MKCAAAVVTIAIGVLAVAGVALVQGTLLDEQTYNDALVQADAYNRVYTEVLTDPEVTDAKEQLLGRLDRSAVDPETARVVSTNALRWAVPPSSLRGGTEAVLAAVLAYVRGDASSIDGDVDVGVLVDRIDETTRREATAALASAKVVALASLPAYREAVAEFLDELAAGRVPDTITLPGGEIDVDDAIAVVIEEIGAIDPDLRLQIETELLAGEGDDALLALSATALDRHVADGKAELRRALEEGREFDVVDEISERAGASHASVIAQLDVVRDAARWFGTPTLILGLLLIIGGGGALVVIHRSDPQAASRWIAGGLALGGGTTLAVGIAIRGIVDSPLDAALGTGDGTWNLPVGMRSVLGDVHAESADTLGSAVLRVALLPMLIAGVLVVVPVVVARLTNLQPRQVALVGAGAAAVLTVVLVGVRWSGDSGDRACNGHAALCDRPYDQVVQAATHNSMSSPNVVFVWPEHDGTMRQQLDAGVRALLIDTHYWPPLVSAEQLEEAADRLPSDVAGRVVELGGPHLAGSDGPYLCHNHCALGGQALTEGLAEIESFLAENPHEVVTFVVQDAISVSDTEAAFHEAGLTPYLYSHDDEDWPTLGELIDRGERLVVFAENEGPPPDWYAPAFEEMQETPYFFATPDDFSCATNRGPDDATLFLMNHWVTRVAPDRKDSLLVNTYDEILERARACEAERGQLPDFIAVNFSEIGETARAVDTLNGVGS